MIDFLKSFFLIQESKLFDGTDLFQKLYLFIFGKAN